MFLRIDNIKRIQQQLVDILKVGFQQPRLDLGQQMTLIGLAVIRFSDMDRGYTLCPHIRWRGSGNGRRL